MPELVLDGFEVGAGGVGEAGGAVAQVVQPHRWQPGGVDQVLEPFGEVVLAGAAQTASRSADRGGPGAPIVETATTPVTRSGCAAASASATAPPME